MLRDAECEKWPASHQSAPTGNVLSQPNSGNQLHPKYASKTHQPDTEDKGFSVQPHGVLSPSLANLGCFIEKMQGGEGRQNVSSQLNITGK